MAMVTSNDLDLEWIDKIPECPVFRPTKEEFEENPILYLHKIAPLASKHGICKIVSPVVASVPASVVLHKENHISIFTTNQQPLRLPRWDKDDTISQFKSGSEFRSLWKYQEKADKVFECRYPGGAQLSANSMEKDFWSEMISGREKQDIEQNVVEYIFDFYGSAFSSSPDDPLGQSKWNLKTFPQLPGSVLHYLKKVIPGITYPMLYVGMLFSMFCWHVEDHFMYNINYHHSGAAKLWYGVPGSAAQKFEKVVHENVYSHDVLSAQGEVGASDILARKTTMIPPGILLHHDVPVCKAVQNPGEYVITFPRAYHSGFSHGFNCGEAVNFATGDWFPFGEEAKRLHLFFRKAPIIPYEGLLCKEAILLASKQDSSSVSPSAAACQRDVKISFVKLMRFQHLVRWLLVKSKGCRSLCSKFKGSVYCGLCDHDCYVAYATCNCYEHPVCLLHDREFQECQCNRKLKIHTKSDVGEMERVALMFEKEKGILEEVNSTEGGVYMHLQSKNFTACNMDGYSPYCKIQLENDHSILSKSRIDLDNVLKQMRKMVKKESSKKKTKKVIIRGDYEENKRRFGKMKSEQENLDKQKFFKEKSERLNNAESLKVYKRTRRKMSSIEKSHEDVCLFSMG